MASPIFRPIDFDLHAQLVLAFRQETSICSFGRAHAWPPGMSDEIYLERMRDRVHAFPFLNVHVWMSNRVVGQLELRETEANPNVGFINFFYLTSEVRGTGLAQELDRYAMREFARKGFSKAQLCVSPTNVRALRFYSKMGWRSIGQDLNEPEVLRMEKPVASDKVTTE